MLKSGRADSARCAAALGIALVISTGCSLRTHEFLVRGGQAKWDAMWQTAQTGTDYNEWCAKHRVRADYEFRIKYPENPREKLEFIQALRMRMNAFVPKEKKDLPSSIKSPDDWREMVFEWRDQDRDRLRTEWPQTDGDRYSLKEWEPKLLWDLSDNLATTMPLDGTYRVAVFLTWRNNDMFGGYYRSFRLLIGPEGRIAGRHCTTSKYYPRVLRAMKRKDVYF